MLVALWLTCLIFGGLGAWVICRYGTKFGLADEPNERSSHKEPTPKGGGIGILAAFLFASILLGFPPLFYLPAGILAALSFLGDKLDLSAKVRLLLQFSAAAVVLFGSGLWDLSPIEQVTLFIPMAVFAVGTANIYNFMDGINGIAAITGIVGFSLLAFYSLATNGDGSFAALSGGLLMSCLGFLPFNMPRARVFMGDGGSVLLGFVFAGAVIALSRSTLDFFCLASFLFTFYSDELNTMFVRIRKGENLLKAHRKHIYQLLANEKGFPHWEVSLGYGLLQAVVGLSVLFVKPFGLLPTLCVLGAYFLAFTIFGSAVRRSVERQKIGALGTS